MKNAPLLKGGRVFRFQRFETDYRSVVKENLKVRGMPCIR